jgi:hypothetical protein
MGAGRSRYHRNVKASQGLAAAWGCLAVTAGRGRPAAPSGLRGGRGWVFGPRPQKSCAVTMPDKFTLAGGPPFTSGVSPPDHQRGEDLVVLDLLDGVAPGEQGERG